MSKAVQPVSLNILDKEYKIACAADEKETLISSARELDRQMRKIRDTGKVSSTDRIAVLAALNLAHDLVASNKTEASGSLDICQRLADLRNKIENVLENP
ncbi:cell division protein ZapA [Methylomonas sp. EFPC1]|uniref:cell division protein ZapA n=1 Tax=Methylomonas sp. EFPC1 TaxID=2812647 RepID=UPI0019687EA1|nr:cell division protein ZapA [Methylomonas sp. EFPC1]QSB00640.1 cell division protein ZapA [Methylomonas sp. EFPC1]